MVKQVYVALTLAFFFFGCGSAIKPVADLSGTDHNVLRERVEQGDFAQAEQILRAWQRAQPAAFTRNNYDYLLAWLLEQRDQSADAIKLFAQVATRNGVLASYALWHQAEQARTIGKFTDEQAALQKLIAQFPDFLRRERATLRLSESYRQTGNQMAALNTLRSLSPRRDTLPLVGETQVALRDAASARLSFEAAMRNDRTDDVTLRAMLNLDKLDTAENKPLSEAN